MNEPRSRDGRDYPNDRLVVGVMYKSRGGGRLLLGLILLGLGLLWTLDNFGIVDSSEIIRFWPMILVVAGAWRMLTERGQNCFVSGLLTFLFGAVLMLRPLGILNVTLWQMWPVLIMILGASIVLKAFRPDSGSTAGGDADNRMNVLAVMGGVHKKSVAPAFLGGEVTAIMAGVELDLRDASPAPGQPVIIDVFTMWGGIDIRVPENWEVVLEMTPLMGGVDDKSHVSPSGPKARLILRGLAVMGGVDIKN